MKKQLSLTINTFKNEQQTIEANNLLRIFENIHNHIYANDGLTPQEAFNEFLKILFLKILDEKNSESKRFYISKIELEESKERHVFRRRINELFELAIKEYPDIFFSGEKINLKDSSLAFAVKHLQDLVLLKSDRDVKGTAFQKFVFSSQRGDRGQFFTPEGIIRLCVGMMKPRSKEYILDPACGTGGFLVESLRFVQKNEKNISASTYAKEKIAGIEISPTVARVAKMRMLFEGDSYSTIISEDSLSSIDRLRVVLNSIDKSKFDIILTNPPFGSQGKITDRDTLSGYSLGYKWAKDEIFQKTPTLQNGQSPEILFIERALDLLKEDGRLAIVLPNGVLENPSNGYVRNYILSRAELLAVITLPQETFIPYGTGVKASVLFLRKSAKKKNQKIFFGRITKVGYEGNKNGSVKYKKDSNGKLLIDDTGQPSVDEDITEILDSYNSFENGNDVENTDNTFILETSLLQNRWDYDYYDPKHKKVDEFFQKYKTVRLGDVVEIIKKKSEKLNFKGSLIKYVELSDVNVPYGEITNSSELFVYDAPSRASYEIKVDDLITAVAGNSVGTKNHATAIVDEKYSGAICTNGFRVLRAPKINKYYLFAFLKSQYFLSQMYKLRTGAAIPAVSDEDFSNIIVPILGIDTENKIIKKIKAGIELRTRAREELNQVFESNI